MSAGSRGLESVRASVDLGTAELVADPRRPEGWTLVVDGVAQSYVDLDDPRHLEFEYVRRFAALVDAAAPAGAPLDLLHLGGGGLTLPRYVAATRPGSRQHVVERDGALVALVRRHLALPVDADVRIDVADARAAVGAAPDARYDVVVSDVFQAARMPRSVATVEFAAQVARVLRPHGVYAVNVTDLPTLSNSRVQAAALRAAFAEVCVLAVPGMLRGRRFGNTVLAAAREPGRLPLTRLTRAVRRDRAPGRALHGSQIDEFIAGARPLRDAAPDRPGVVVPTARQATGL